MGKWANLKVGTQILKLIGGKMSGKEMKQEMPWLAYVLNFDPFAKRTPMSKAECKAMFESHDFDAMVRGLRWQKQFMLDDHFDKSSETTSRYLQIFN